MKFFQKRTIDFVGKRHYAVAASTLLIVLSIVSLGIFGLRFGIDFTGGTLIEIGFDKPQELADIRQKLQKFQGASAQYFGSKQEILIRLEPQKLPTAALSSEVVRILDAGGGGVDIRRVEFVGPKVGEELTNDGGLAILYALIGILIYVAFRFEYRFSLGAISAVVHDVIIALGFFSLFQIEFDLAVLAAILAVIGYSLNDTIVVFDRIRENFLTTRKTAPETVVNNALNQTLARTIMTSATTLLVLLALFFLGGEILRGFSVALIIGVVVGTYSSIYVAGTIILALGIDRKDLLPSEKEQKAIDTRP